MKDGATKATAVLSPKAEAPVDPISLSNKSKKGPDLYVAMGLAAERSGKTAEAEKMYKKALEIGPNDAGALLAYGHLLDRRGKLAEAEKHYQKCCSKHPENATSFNDLGLCLHRQGQLTESATALRKAVDLQPDRKLYRNNLATVLVEQGRRDEAFKVLATMDGAATAHYNLGYLLQQQGDSHSAIEQFQMALNTDPSLAAAQQWIDKLANGGVNSTPMLAKTNSRTPSYTLETPTIEMPRQPAAGRYDSSSTITTETAAATPGNSYYSDETGAARQTTRAYPVKYPLNSQEAGDTGEMPPTPAEAGVELLPPVPSDLN
jgi:Flp pilus assembly protein TadD